MKRSAGITISAGIVFFGSAVPLLWGASMFLSVWLARAQVSQPRFWKYGMCFLGVFLVGFAALGVASGVGLLRLRKWARISLLVFSGLLLVCSLPGLVMFLTTPIRIPPNAHNPELFRQTMVWARASTDIFCGILIALGSFWLWFFNKRTIREQFDGTKEFNSSEATLPRRPWSISIIGWCLLVSAFGCATMVFRHFPVFLLGFVLKGRGAALIWLMMCFLQAVMGIGLLKLKAWARIITICYSAFFIFNAFIVVLIPSAQVRFESVQAEIQNILGIPTVLKSIQNPIHFPMWFGIAFALPVLGVQLWFLVVNKGAFMPAPPPSESLH